MDQQRGIVRIPIERAMEMLVQQGLPARAGAAYAPPRMPDKSNSGRDDIPPGR